MDEDEAIYRWAIRGLTLAAATRVIDVLRDWVAAAALTKVQAHDDAAAEADAVRR
jgi:hypothetical protein